METLVKREQGMQLWLVILGMLIAVGPLSIDMYLPSFSEIRHSLPQDGGSVEFTLASFFVGLMLGQLFYGPFSDRFGRKPPLTVGLLLYITASLGAASSQSLEQLVVWQFCQGLGGCAGMVIANAVIRDRTSGRDSARAFSLIVLVMGLAPILAPLAGGAILALWGWRAIFLILASFGGICLVSLHFLLAESHETTHEPPLRLGVVLNNYRGLIANRAFLGFLLTGAFSISAMFSYIAGSPFVLMDLHDIAPGEFGWYFGFNAFGLILASQINARLLRRYAPTKILRLSLWIPLLASLVLLVGVVAGIALLPLFLVAFFLVVSSVGFINPNATASALATHGQQAGTAAALLGAAVYLFATFSGFLVGLLNDGTERPLALIMFVCTLSAWLANRLVLPHRQHPEATS